MSKYADVLIRFIISWYRNRKEMNENSLKENTQEIHGFIIAITKVILIIRVNIMTILIKKNI